MSNNPKLEIELRVDSSLAPSVLRAFAGATPLDAEVDALEVPLGECPFPIAIVRRGDVELPAGLIKMSDERKLIVTQYAEWTALSALRSGAPIKSRNDVYGAMRAVDFAPLFDTDLGSINTSEFNAWHEKSLVRLLRREPRLTVGWGAKILNVYLKTRCYRLQTHRSRAIMGRDGV